MTGNGYVVLATYGRVALVFRTNIFHDLLPSDHVAQWVEQRWSNPKVVGSIPTLVRVFLWPFVGPIPLVVLTLTWSMGWNTSTLHYFLSLYSFWNKVTRLELSFKLTRRKWVNCKAMLSLNLLVLVQQVSNLKRSGLNYPLRHVVKSSLRNSIKTRLNNTSLISGFWFLL